MSKIDEEVAGLRNDVRAAEAAYGDLRKRFDEINAAVARAADLLDGAQDSLADVLCWFRGFYSARPEAMASQPPGLNDLVDIREALSVLGEALPKLRRGAKDRSIPF